MSKEKIEKAIPICKKSIATAKEILTGCGGVIQIYLEGKEEIADKGLMSVSIAQEGHCLSVCVWKERKDEKYEKITHLSIFKGGLSTLKGYAEIAANTEPESHT